MPTDQFSHAFTVAAPADRIYAHLSAPESYVGLSPLVVAVRDVRREGDAVAYVAVERFTLGPWHWDNPIRVRMTFPEPGRRLVSDVRSPGWVRLVATVDLAAEGDATRVTESVSVRYPWILRSFVVGQARSVQRARAAELTRRMEAAPTPAG
ncbi:SRPBCC family protein [Couchioplanes caeruleus]|uniref:SRPBCC family protein n=1 Tax=Couchioplanes caeruleus TaxID=56438 RepID=UPI0020C09A52|nr:SRPBCC family protein [Couchioplanes caeruleus]UQU61622.1 SRPBCC family protein [Couchioplanes caeruleus]